MRHPALRACLSAVLLLAVPLAAAASGRVPKLKVEVIVATANVRSTPAMTGSIISRLSKGTVLEAEKVEGPWFKVTLPPDKAGAAKFGYMHQSVVKAIEEPEAAPAATAAPAAKAEKAAAPKPSAKKKFEFSLLGGAGFTAVDVAKDLDIEEDDLEDWDKFHWRIAAQAIYRLKPNLGVGIEASYQSLYYFYYITPYAEGQDAYRENTVTATTVGGLVDYHFGRYFFAQAVAGVVIYEDSTLFSIGGAVGAEFPISQRLAVPVMARVDFVPQGPSPAALVVGLKVKI